MATIACIIPAYNESRFIADVVKGIPPYVDHIIVVDDASKDGTGDVVRRLQDPRVILVQHEKNRGVGGAMVSGYKKALEIGADLAAKMDGDGQMNPEVLRHLMAPILRGEADYTKGVRFRDSDSLREMPWLRIFGNLGLSFLTKVASGYWNVFDPTNGYTVIGAAALRQLRLDKLSSGYFFETSMLINLYRIDAFVLDIPMKARYGAEESKLNPFKVFISFPFYLLKALIKRIIWRYFIRDFTACSAFLISGLLLFAFGFLFGSYHWVLNYIRNVPTPIGTVMFAAVPLIMGFELLLQAVVLDIQSYPKIPIARFGFEGSPEVRSSAEAVTVKEEMLN